jgi:hypothetical protein
MRKLSNGILEEHALTMNETASVIVGRDLYRSRCYVPGAGGRARKTSWRVRHANVVGLSEIEVFVMGG